MTVYLDTLYIHEGEHRKKLLIDVLDSIGGDLKVDYLQVTVKKASTLVKVLQAARHCKHTIAKINIKDYFAFINQGKYYNKARYAIRQLEEHQFSITTDHENLVDHQRQMAQFKFRVFVITSLLDSELRESIEKLPYVCRVNYDPGPYSDSPEKLTKYMRFIVKEGVSYATNCIQICSASVFRPWISCEAGIRSMTLWPDGLITNCPHYRHSVVYQARTLSSALRAFKTAGMESAWANCPLRECYGNARKDF